METKTTKTKKINPVKKVENKSSVEIPLYSQDATSVGVFNLPTSVFAVKWNADLVHQVVVSMMSNKRAGLAHTKDRGEVSGGGKKPWKQKGTGRARHGSNRSPIWIGGGVTFGPRNDKEYGKKINKKMKVKAFYTVLSKKAKDNEILAIENIAINTPKTKDALSILQSFKSIKGYEKLDSKKPTNILMMISEKNENLEKSFANLPGVNIKLAKDTNVVDIIKYSRLVFIEPQKITDAFIARMK